MAAGVVMGRVLAALLGGLVVAGATSGIAVAAPTSLQVSPARVPAGGSVHVSGTCEANTSGFAISPAFLHDASHDFAGVGAVPFSTDATGAFSVDAQIPAARIPASYTVTGRCGGGNLGVQATLVVVSAGGVPTGVPAGSGGHAATTASGTREAQLVAGGLGLLLVAGGAFGLAWRRRPARS